MIFSFKTKCSYCGLLRNVDEMTDDSPIDDRDILLGDSGLMCPDSDAGGCLDRHQMAWEEKIAAEVAAAPIV